MTNPPYYNQGPRKITQVWENFTPNSHVIATTDSKVDMATLSQFQSETLKQLLEWVNTLPPIPNGMTWQFAPLTYRESSGGPNNQVVVTGQFMATAVFIKEAPQLPSPWPTPRPSR